MGEVTLSLVLFAVLVVAVVARKVTNWFTRRKWTDHEELEFLVSDLGLTRTADRFLHDTRIVRYAGVKQGCQTLVESGVGPGTKYCRIDFSFRREVPLGVRISSEREEGLLTRVMRMREIEIGLRHFDDQFILLSRSEERLKELLDHDLRGMLIGLRTRVRDVRLNDRGLHLQLFGAFEKDDFIDIFREGAELASRAFKRAEGINESADDGVESSSAFIPVSSNYATAGDIRPASRPDPEEEE